MQIPTLKLRSGNDIPRLGLGTYMIGGGMTRDPNNDDEGQIEGIRYAIEHGISWIRTAQNYAEGYCEEIIGKAIKGYPREKLYINGAVNERFAGTKNELHKQAIDSLKRLGIDFFDLYMIGGLDQRVSIKEMATGLMELKKIGLTKDIGIGNYRLEELKILDEATEGNLVYDEVHFNLIIREPMINGVWDYCIKNDLLMGVYRSLQLGQLSKEGVKVLDDISSKYHKSQAQIAIKWILMHEGTATLVKSINPKHIDEIIGVWDWDLDPADFKSLSRDFPVQIRLSDCTPPQKFFSV